MSVDGARCPWARSPAMIAYHDAEWGVPQHDDARLFELLSLEGAQAGLSWETILNKRSGYRRAFERFDIERVAAFDDADIARLVADAAIVRHRGKIAAAIANARAIRAIVASGVSFGAYVWERVAGVPLVNAPASPVEIPTTTPLATAFSRDLRSHGFSFVGPTIVYSFMQAAGLVDDHLASCPWSSRA
jgi:DNA-3-methyladenine glycosylase I